MNNNIFNSVYNGKKVLVTGHTGFKGGWLSLWLKKLGVEVIGYSLESPTKPSFFKARGLKNKLIHIIGDVRDEKYLVSVFEKYQPEFVFHLAAQPFALRKGKISKLKKSYSIGMLIEV